MALLDIFKKKPKADSLQHEAPAPFPAMPEMPPSSMGPDMGEMPQMSPIDQVESMKAQGMPNEEIISTLQSQGYNPKQIYDAIAQAEAGPAGSPMGPGAPVHEMPAQFGPAKSFPKAPEGFEELAESIIEEKWTEMTKEFGKFNEWKELTESRLSKLEQSVSDIKSDLDNLHKAIVSKIGDYDKNLLDVGTEIKAMEKVFQKVLPELTSSVQELGRITQTAKARPVLLKKVKKA